jgi:hypothetical protein
MSAHLYMAIASAITISIARRAAIDKSTAEKVLEKRD